MEGNLVWQLPPLYHTEEILSKISWDGQAYFVCPHCSWEERFDPFYVSGITFIDTLCRECEIQSFFPLVRHLEQLLYDCDDCGKSFHAETAGFETIRCPHCLSTRLTLLSQQISPPFPPRFGPGMKSKKQSWGISAREDGESLQAEILETNVYPDFSFYLLWGIRFCRRLRLYSSYEQKQDHALMFNLEGLLFREYFRLTLGIPAGLEALILLEESVRMTDEPIQRALVEHNVGLAVYSLLSQYPEDLVSLLAGRPYLREEGIAAAERALSLFESEAYPGMSWFPVQSARIHHLLGDLLKVGNADDMQLQLAIAHCNRALESGTLPPDSTNWVRETRAIAIALLDNQPRALRDQAIEDLEQVILIDETGSVRPQKWRPLLNLANLYIDGGQQDQALPLLEQAAAIALNEIEMILDEEVLLQRSQWYIRIFERLAYLYIMLGRAEQGLEALEILRAATVRLHTMSHTDTYERLMLATRKAAAQLGLVHSQGKALHTQIKDLQLPPVSSYINKLMQYLSDMRTAFITFTTFDTKNVTAMVIMPKESTGYDIRVFEWQTKRKLDELLRTYRMTEPSKMREARLEELCRSGYKVLFASLFPLLRDLGIERIAISAPGRLNNFPFEALRYTQATSDFVHDQFEIFYLPSLKLGADLIESATKRGGGNLLIVGYQGNDLPYTRDEVWKLKSLWKNQVTLLEDDACTKMRVLDELRGDYDYIHFTCHGSFAVSSPLDSALHLVPDPKRDSQRITARDILGLRFQHSPVITLSACSSALISDSVTNDCAGLTGSFLRSGARCVMGSRWPVYDEVAELIMLQLYDKLSIADVSPQHCLHEVQAKMAKNFNIENWAAFGYLGLP